MNRDNSTHSMTERVIDFVTNNTGVAKAKINLDSKIESDFGMAGLDTISFYEDFFMEFEIKNPEDFILDNYVTSEGLSNLNLILIFKSIFSKTAREQLRIKEVSIRHLVKVAESKYWVEES